MVSLTSLIALCRRIPAENQHRFITKTTTCHQVAKSAIFMDEPEHREQNIARAQISPSAILDGEVRHYHVVLRETMILYETEEIPVVRNGPAPTSFSVRLLQDGMGLIVREGACWKVLTNIRCQSFSPLKPAKAGFCSGGGAAAFKNGIISAGASFEVRRRKR